MINQWERNISSGLEKKIGKTFVKLEGGHDCRKKECSIANLFLDGVVRYMLRMEVRKMKNKDLLG